MTFRPNALKGLFALPRNLQCAALGKLELVYDETLSKGKFSTANAYKASWLRSVYIMSSVEYLFILSGVFIVLTSYGALAITVNDFGLAASMFWATMAPVTVFLSTLISFSLLPFYYLKGWNIWVVTGVGVVVFSIFVSLFGSILWIAYSGETTLNLFKVFWFVFSLYLVSWTFLILLNNAQLCYFNYQRRIHAQDLELDVPVHTRGELIALSAQDQMVKIITNRGEHLVRESLYNAIKRIPTVEGIKVHRSYWVAKRAMRRLDKHAGKNVVIMSNGQRIPVTDTKINDVKNFLA